MPRTDANKQVIIELLTAAAKPASDGTLYVRAATATKIIGVNSGQRVMWEKRGWIRAMRFRVPAQRGASIGVIVAWPLDQVIDCVRRRVPLDERRWSDAHEDYLLQWLGTRSMAYIAERLGRSEHAVRKRGYLLGINARTNAGKLTTGDVAGLCRRSRQAVQLWCLGTRGRGVRGRGRGLKFVRLPHDKGEKLIDPADLAAFLDRNPRIRDGLPESSRRALQRMTAELPRRDVKLKPEPDPGPRVYRRGAA